MPANTEIIRINRALDFWISVVNLFLTPDSFEMMPDKVLIRDAVFGMS